MTECKSNNLATSCPICGLNNDCAQENATVDNRNEAGNCISCWCMDAKITKELKQDLKINTNACICKNCISKIAYKQR